ncbi:MAG: spermidine synthase [Beijerinckiaceae bacterium]
MAAARRKRDALTLGLFTGTILISAFLLFAVQPMFTKLVLPQLGGSPAVWSVAMVFFQGLLLAGYLYAHLSTRYLGHRTAVIVHGALLVASFLMLPLTVSDAFGEPPVDGQAFWLIGVFAASVGLPFLALSATAPLMQAWFARSGHPAAGNPYQLYVASNIGSFAALLLYPLLVEPMLSLNAQTRSWMILFALLGAALVIAGGVAMAARTGETGDAASDAAEDAPVSLRTKLNWIGLAAVPSGLLVAATAHLSTDVASAPLLWVVPLALFMLTFILAFREKLPFPHASMVKAFCYVAPFAVLTMSGIQLPIWSQFLIHFLTLFLAAMICHRQLYELRPSPKRLTEFYLWMSFGGMLGGIFAGLAAPLLFNTLMEYKLLILAAVVCVPVAAAPAPWRKQAALVAMCFGLVALYAAFYDVLAKELPAWTLTIGRVAAAVCLAFLVMNRTGRIANVGGLAAAFVALHFVTSANDTHAVRSFFGVNYVKTSPNGQFRILTHGSTIHGAVRIADEKGNPVTGRPEPTVYYHDEGGINMALRVARANAGGKLGSVAVLGLGAGAMACQSAEGEKWTFFEIDKSVIDLALRKDLFPFVRTCTPDAKIVAGDARLTIQQQVELYDVIVLDTFSSDAVPAHLLTQEAFANFAARLAPGGMIIAHVSNRYMDIQSVAEASGLANGLAVATGAIWAVPGSANAKRVFAVDTQVVAMAREPDRIAGLLSQNGWRLPDPAVKKLLWTDDYANVAGALARELAPRLPRLFGNDVAGK